MDRCSGAGLAGLRRAEEGSPGLGILGVGEAFQWFEGIGEVLPFLVGELPKHHRQLGAAGVERLGVLHLTLRGDLDEYRPHIGWIAR